jgi:CTP:molybdopterin cytidylyltransferase MocA
MNLDPVLGSIAFLIPAYNEEATVADVVTVTLRSGLGEVVVVSDGSIDQTVQMARDAGARVIVLEKNVGKGGAVAAGVKAIKAQTMILLDADLKNLTVFHLHQLLEPLRSGKAETTVGLFSGGRGSTDFGNRITPKWSGQRAIPHATLANVNGLEDRKYAIELAITDQIEREGLRLQYVRLEGVSQVMKEEKRGFLGGLSRRVKMYWQIAHYAIFERRKANKRSV